MTSFQPDFLRYSLIDPDFDKWPTLCVVYVKAHLQVFNMLSAISRWIKQKCWQAEQDKPIYMFVIKLGKDHKISKMHNIEKFGWRYLLFWCTQCHIQVILKLHLVKISLYNAVWRVSQIVSWTDIQLNIEKDIA